MSKRRNRRRRETRNEVLQALAPIPIPAGDALTIDALPERLRLAIHALAGAIEAYGTSEQRATEAAFVGGCIAARAAGVWPSVVAEAHGVRV